MTTNILLQAALWSAVLFVVYAVLARGLFRAAEPLRQAVLDLACDLNASGELPDLEKSVIEASLDDLHSVRAAWNIARIGVVVLVTSPFRPSQSAARDGFAQLTPESAKKFERLQFYWMISTIANSPMAAAIFIVSGMLGTAFSASGGLVTSVFNSGHRGGDNNHPRVRHA